MNLFFFVLIIRRGVCVYEIYLVFIVGWYGFVNYFYYMNYVVFV